MIEKLIRWSLGNRLLVLLLAAILALAGLFSMRTVPLDAIPDLTDVQVTIRVSMPGQAPQVIEDQVTYPLSTAMLAVPGAVAVRGYSFFGDSYIYVIFADGTDLYWARSRVLEYLNSAAKELPPDAVPSIGPDATGVGWVYQYALVDRTGQHDLAQLRSLQDWFLKFELEAVPGVAEVASVGGMVKQYQIVMDPDRLRGYYVTLDRVEQAIKDANQESGGGAVEMAEAEYMVRLRGYIRSLEDIGLISVDVQRSRVSLTNVPLFDLAQEIRIGPAARRGIADLNGEGEVTGGIVVMRAGSNARDVITAVRAKLDTLKAGLPDGIELVETYDRSALIERTVDTLKTRLIEEFIVVIAVCALFLYHFRSSLVILLTLPVGILTAFLVIRVQGINANVMSLGGIAIAIGTMVDAAIVMIENVHKHLERLGDNASGRLQAIERALVEVGPALFFSLLIITLSFLPVFALEGQELRLFAPLAYTKTYAMAAAAGLSVTLLPVLVSYLVRGKIRPEQANPINRWLIDTYMPLIRRAMAAPWLTLALGGVLVLSAIWPWANLGREFMPDLDEGDLLYMPSAPPGISVGKARQLLQQVDRLIKTVPEVDSVFGKVGRADTATDPAPLAMIESTIRLKPREQWRPGMDMDDIKRELDDVVRIPGLNNAWLMPIRARIDMQSTGINTPIGIKIAGADNQVIERIGLDIERILGGLENTRTVFSDRTSSGRYIDIDIDRRAAEHYGLSIAEIQNAAAIAIGGKDVTRTIEGRERYPVNLRYPEEFRDSLTKLRGLPLVATDDIQVQLGDVANVQIVDGPDMIKSEDARVNGWVYITAKDDDIGGYVGTAQAALAEQLKLPAGYSWTWVGHYQFMQRAEQRMAVIIPITVIGLFLLLFMGLRSVSEALMVMVAVPLSLVGGFWLLYLLDYQMSVAVGVGLIALAGVAAEFGVVMLVYLRESQLRNQPTDRAGLLAAVIEGAVMRVRPKAMTAAVVVAGLLPIMLGEGSGSDVMRRIAAPMVGGMITAPIVSMLLIPVMYYLWHGRRFAAKSAAEPVSADTP
ncbi:MAG: CusA/CzcA family heavy metal efflux RND transporter [Xanthomonadaceae bacterium]|nr:CusA/CzcA family heavy metal efflux RND transporter [Xanthomonadaceae bacterium]MDP2186201.1 CusA/CzcA family heavy metal efflux RND transporter [Xanthomonadales bacterium]MDZ4117033.1 CusA/CzcA family heavy metal efflux RND transporter [Xanthomonadaceae bacterium]MDZ4378572.1 CusA/CzcA family heavy metal efflux RND transporter [Xanthomonadaceae bacterium]